VSESLSILTGLYPVPFGLGQLLDGWGWKKDNIERRAFQIADRLLDPGLFVGWETGETMMIPCNLKFCK